jgi:Helicase conserved C-terminal domain
LPAVQVAAGCRVRGPTLAPVPKDLSEYARLVPLNALTAFSLGPLRASGVLPQKRLALLQSSDDGVWAALDSAGTQAHRVVTVLAALGGSASAQEFAFQTSMAEPAVIKETIARMVAARLVSVARNGTVELAAYIRREVAGATLSLADPTMSTSDTLGFTCKALGLQPGSRKQERVDAIASAFADPSERTRILSLLSAEAIELLNRIARQAGPRVIDSSLVGISQSMLRYATPQRFAMRVVAPTPDIAPLRDLAALGIIGVSEWDSRVWVWREAWPLVARPFVTDWKVVPRPKVVALADSATRVPPCVTALDQALRAWQLNPPPALKNDQPRIGKSELRSAAKSLRVDEAILEIASRLAIGIGLLLSNEVGRSGRGRSLRIDKAWMPDASMLAGWDSLSPMQRWARLVAEWCRPKQTDQQQLLINQHLVLWELASVPNGNGYSDAHQFAAWFADHYATIGVAEEVLECIADLRALGLVTSVGVRLTSIGRAVLERPDSVADAFGSGSTQVVVQADLTVIAPPDLRHDLLGRLETIAEAESTAGAFIYRLDPARIARAVQSGHTPEELTDFLTQISSVALPGTVVRLLHDSAKQARSVRLVTAPTVVIFDDPVDLTTACALNSLRLTKLSDSVAMTDVPAAKVRAALERKGLAPETVSTRAEGSARSSATEAAKAEQRAAELRQAAKGRTNSFFEYEAKALEERARQLGDIDGRLRVTGPLAITPALLATLDNVAGS